MRTISLYAPRPVEVEALITLLSLVCVVAQEETVKSWTELEKALAYDWAMRCHLSASDNLVQARPRPMFIPVDWGTP